METSPTSSGASNAPDFQPPTSNPQSNVGGDVQPVTPTNGSNVFNEPGINAQAFPATDNLKVQSNGSSQPASAVPVATITSSGWTPLAVFLLTTIVLVSIILLIARSAKPAAKQVDEPVKPARATNKSKTNKKKTAKKKSSKKRR